MRPQRINKQKWPRHPEDWYVEENWIWHRYFEVEQFGGVIVDPCCGSKRVVLAALAAGYVTSYGDIKDRPQIDGGEKLGATFISDFMSPRWSTRNGWQKVHNFAFNGPFRWCEGGESFCKHRLSFGSGFIGLALSRARNKIAALLPATWGGGIERSQWLATTPLKSVRLIVPRISMPPGPTLIKMMKRGERAGGGIGDFAIYTWEHGYEGKPEYGWLRRDREAS